MQSFDRRNRRTARNPVARDLGPVVSDPVPAASSTFDRPSEHRFPRRKVAGRVAGSLLVCMGLLLVGAVSAGQPPETEPVAPLFDADRFPEGWVLYSADDKKNSAETWMVRKAEGDKPAVLVCTGQPYGYIRTKKTYRNYEVTLEWNYPEDPNGNSGLLIHTNGEDKIWPTSIQVQLHLPAVGSTFPSGDAKTANTLQTKNMKLAPKTWHRCRVRSEDGKITVFINGKKIGEVTGCEPSKGAVALQSEGSEIHFRNIRLRKLPDKSDESRDPGLSE